LELSAIFLGGAAALIMGHALLDPGQYRRSEYLSVRGKEAGMLALGCVPMLAMAGVLEAFFSPSPLPEWFKLVFAATSFSSLLFYLFVYQPDVETESELKSFFVNVYGQARGLFRRRASRANT